MLKHGIDPAFSRRGSKFKTPVCRYARPWEAATTRSTNFASVSCCARLTANPGGDWRKAHSKRDCNCANLYYSLPNEHPRTVSGGTHAHVSGQQEATSIPNGTASPLPRSKKIIIKHCRPLRRLAKLYLRSKGVVHWKEGGRKFSGTGSSQKLVQAKVRKMLRYFNVSSTWPSKRLAAEKWKLRLQPPLRLTPVRRLSRPLGRSAPPTRGRWEMLPGSHAPAPVLHGGVVCRTPTDWRRSPCRTWQETMNLPTLLQSFSIRPNRGRQNCMTCTYFPEQLWTFWWGLSTPKKKTSNKMTSRHQPWLTPSLPYCPLHFSNCICSSFMTSRWKGAYKQ